MKLGNYYMDELFGWLVCWKREPQKWVSQQAIAPIKQCSLGLKKVSLIECVPWFLPQSNSSYETFSSVNWLKGVI